MQRPFNRRATIGCHGVLTGACANTAEPTNPTANESKITEPPHICTATPPTANRPAPSAPTGRTAPAGREQAKGLKLGLPTPPQTRGGRPESRPSDGPARLQRSSPPPGHRPHPRYRKSAIWVSSQCDALTNEFPDFKANGTANAPPVIAAHNDYERMTAAQTMCVTGRG